MSRYDPGLHHRRSTRLAGHDYSQPGAYFVTICVQRRECIFGSIADGEMRPNMAGAMVEAWWRDLPGRFPSCVADAFVLMPNHVHGVIEIRDHAVGADRRVRPHGSHARDVRTSLPRVVQWFKTMTTNAYLRGVNECDWPPFPGRLWQRNYYDHVVRNEAELARIREYIMKNPLNWRHDPDNPDNLPPARPS